MPTAPGRICNRCRKTIPSGQKRCACRPAFEGSAWTGGSTRRWRKRRAQQLADHPICQWPGCTRLAKEVDHVHNLAAGGDMYETPLQSLCVAHHRAKTQRESRTP